MDERLMDLYKLPPGLLEQDLYILDLRQQCADAEQRLRDIMECLSSEQAALLDSYIQFRDELEFQSVKQAIRFGKNQISKPLG